MRKCNINERTSIGKEAFSNCGFLESVTIPETVTTIGEGAFQWCEKLSSVKRSSLAEKTVVAKADMLKLLREEKAEELLEYAQMYLDSISTKEPTDEEKDAEELKGYLENHKSQLTNYRSRGKEIPKSLKALSTGTWEFRKTRTAQ